MEQLGDIDTDSDMHITLPEIIVDDKGNGITELTDETRKVAQFSA